MKKFKKNKYKIILALYALAAIILAIKLIFFNNNEAYHLFEKLSMGLIVFLSVLIITFIILPRHKSFKAFFIKYRDLFLLSMFIFGLEIGFIVKNQLDYSYVTFFSIAFLISVFVYISLLLPKKLKVTFIILTFILLPIYLIGQDIFYMIFNEFFSVKLIVYAKEGADYSEGVVRFSIFHLIYVLLSIIAIITLLHNQVDNQVKLRRKRWKMLLVPILFLILVNLNAEYPKDESEKHLSDDYLYTSLYNNRKFVAHFGSMNYLFRDIIDSVIPKHGTKQDVEEINQYFQTHQKGHEKNAYTGLFENKNLLFITAESFDPIALSETLTPNLMRLKNEGLNFKNHYVPVYPRTTIDSEFIFNTSLVPSITDGPTCHTFKNNTFSYSLGRIFSDAGYTSEAFHSNKKEFYSRDTVYEGFGYHQFYGQEELGITDENKYFDTDFIEEIKDLIFKEDEKFFSFITTMSGHSPYTMNNPVVQKYFDIVDEYYGNRVHPSIKNYIATQIELDRFVGKVFSILEEKGLLQNTVIVFTTDHYPYTITPPEIFENEKGTSHQHLKSQAPLFIWADGIEHKTISKLNSSFDILPTLANLFHVPTDYTYYFGNDIFSDDYLPVVFYKDYSWYDGTNYVRDGKLRSGDTNKDYVNKTTKMIFDYFEISHKILRTDYFNKQD